MELKAFSVNPSDGCVGKSHILYLLCCRYRIGDVVKVVGFHNQCPIVEFQYRYCTGQPYSFHYAARVYTVGHDMAFFPSLFPSSARRGQMLNVRGEKVSEALFLDALKKAVAQWPGAQLVDYCCAESGILGNVSCLYPLIYSQKKFEYLVPIKHLCAISCFIYCGIAGDSIGGSDPHYQVFLELKGVRRLTEEQRHKVGGVIMKVTNRQHV